MTKYANIMLIFVTLLWGLTFPLIKLALVHISPSMFVLVRFILAALIFLPVLLWDLRHSTRTLLFAGLALGLMNSIIYLTQTIGLQTISPSRSAFITGMNVILVPFLLPLAGLGRPGKRDIGCALLSLMGLYILTAGGHHTFSTGDAWTLLCAIAYAVVIVFIQWLTLTCNVRHYRLLTFYQILFTIPAAAIAATGNNISGLFQPHVVIALLFCASGATVLAFYLQLKYQQHTSANQAALIYCLEPVFATLTAFVMIGNAIPLQTWIGGAIMLSSLIISIHRR